MSLDWGCKKPLYRSLHTHTDLIPRPNLDSTNPDPHTHTLHESFRYFHPVTKPLVSDWLIYDYCWSKSSSPNPRMHLLRRWSLKGFWPSLANALAEASPAVRSTAAGKEGKIKTQTLHLRINRLSLKTNSSPLQVLERRQHNRKRRIKSDRLWLFVPRWGRWTFEQQLGFGVKRWSSAVETEENSLLSLLDALWHFTVQSAA